MGLNDVKSWARRSVEGLIASIGWSGGGFMVGAGGLGGRRVQGVNTTGVAVNERSALSLPAAYAGVNAVSTDLASLPLRLVQVVDGAERQATEHRAYGLWMRSPDGGGTTPMRFRQALMSHVLTYGSGYAEIVNSNDRGRVYLYLLDPASTQPYLDADRVLQYRIAGVGGASTAAAERVLHLSGLSYDGVCGYGLVTLARQAFGLGLAAERFGGSYLGKGVYSSGLLKSPQGLTPKAFEELVDSFVRNKVGSEQAGGVGILPPGFEYESMSSSPVDAQLCELRAFQVLEMARLFRLPPHKLGDYTKASYASIEAANLEYVQTTLLPWAVAFEQALNLRLLTEGEQVAGFTFKHDFTAFLRADAAGRSALYTTMFQAGALTPNEIRAGEGYQPRGDAAAGQTYSPLNLQGSDSPKAAASAAA
jgi:HK97 family phage portal protein